MEDGRAPVDAVLDALERAVPWRDPRDPVVLDTLRARRGLLPDPGWGAHCGLPLFLALAATTAPDEVLRLVGAGAPAAWVAAIDEAGWLDRAPILELGGAMVDLLGHPGHRAVDARYGAGPYLGFDTPVDARFGRAVANAVFEEGSGVVGTLVGDTRRLREALGPAWGRWRAEAARAAAVDVWVGLRAHLEPGAVVLVSNVLSPPLPLPDEVAAALGLRALPPRFVARAATRYGVLQTDVRGAVVVGEPAGVVVGPVFTRPDGSRGRLRYESGRRSWAG